MKRRHFCTTAVSASLLAAYPYKLIHAAAAESSAQAVALDGSEIEIEKASLRELGEAVKGPVLLPSDAGYDSARRIWNGMHDKRPAVIARCADADDIRQAVDWGRESGILVAVRGGGHSWPGKSVCDGGLMIDLAEMNRVTVDRDTKRAYAKGGALLNHLDTASLAQGLVTNAGVVSHTGVGGFTLGGGFGRLNRKYGLTIDNLVSVKIVTPDGKLRHVSADNEPDLFWALRGGGGNFGVVSEFEYQLHPFDRSVLSGMIVWPIAQARDVLDFYGGWYAGLSDNLYVGPAMMTMPDGTGIIAMEVVYAGDPAAGEKELQPLRQVGTPMEDGVKVQDYMVMQTKEDGAFAHGVRSYAKNGMVREITPGLVNALVESWVPDPRLAVFTHTAGGAVKRVDELATAFPHRNAETMIIVGGGWMDPAQDAEAIAIARQWFSQLEPFTGGYYDNIEFDGSSTADNYGPAYDRLARIKGRYDPANMFRLNRNIEPVNA